LFSKWIGSVIFGLITILLSATFGLLMKFYGKAVAASADPAVTDLGANHHLRPSDRGDMVCPQEDPGPGRVLGQWCFGAVRTGPST
jgi:hypothetical protein